MPMRSRKQLAALLKLIQVNNISLTRKNVSIRQKVWQAIATKLNDMDGAEKDVDGWKRSYHAWRLSVGESYSAELEKIVQNVDDDYFVITVSEDEMESVEHAANEPAIKTPMEIQKTRLHELVMKNRDILQSTADDEPLKTRIWLNISEELNAIPDALKLTPAKWQNCVDWNIYSVRRGRKATKRTATAAAIKTTRNVKRILAVSKDKRQVVQNAEFELIDNALPDACNEEYETIDESIIEEDTEMDVHAVQYKNIQENSKFITYAEKPQGKATISQRQQHHHPQEQQQHKLHMHADTDDDDFDIDYIAEDYTEIADNDEDIDDIDYDDMLTANNLEDDDIDEDERAQDDIEFTQYQSKSHRIKTTPLVKYYKYSTRIVDAIGNLNNDVSSMKNFIKTTTHTLTNMEKLLQQQCKQQDEINAQLKRNSQLLKLLVEFKSGRAPNSLNLT